MSHDPLTTWSLEVTWQTESFTKWKYLLFPGSMITKLCRVTLWREKLLLSHRHMESRDKLRTNYPLLHNACDHQTCRMVAYNEGNSTDNDTLSSDRVVTWYLVTCQKLNISTSTKSMTSKHGKLVIYGERNPLMESHDSMMTWSCVFTW